MIVRVILNTKTNGLSNLDVNLPDDIRDYTRDTVTDVVSDYLTDNKIDCERFYLRNIAHENQHDIDLLIAKAHHNLTIKKGKPKYAPSATEIELEINAIKYFLRR